MRSFDVVSLIEDEEHLSEKIQEDRPEIMAQVRFGMDEELAFFLTRHLYSQDAAILSCS